MKNTTKEEFIKKLESKKVKKTESNTDEKITIQVSLPIYYLNDEDKFFTSVESLINYIKENQLDQIVVNKESYSLDLSTFN